MPLLDTIYIDMDGVLAGFDEHMIATFGIMKEQRLSSAERWARINEYEASGHKWFADLPIKAGALAMVRDIYKLVKAGTVGRAVILTATGNNFWVHKQQKVWWVVNSDIGSHVSDIIVVPKAECKQYYANNRSVLIDDNWDRCVEPFIERGGFGIHHLQPELTMMKLNNIIAMLQRTSE